MTSKQRLFFREHKHDGTDGSGGHISHAHDNLVIGHGAAGVDYTLTFDGQTYDGVLTWMEDEDYLKASDDLLMDTTERLYFRDTGLYVYSGADGYLDLVADTDVRINTYPVRPVPIDGLYVNFGTAPATDLGYGTWSEETAVGMELYDLSVTNAVGFYGSGPIAQPAAVADATNATDVILRLNDLLARMRSLGLIAT
jgi:hypothetical protein